MNNKILLIFGVNSKKHINLNNKQKKIINKTNTFSVLILISLRIMEKKKNLDASPLKQVSINASPTLDKKKPEERPITRTQT